MDLLLATSGGEAQAASGGYVDDVFSAYTYTGNGSTQTINNGIDLAGKGGLVGLRGGLVLLLAIGWLIAKEGERISCRLTLRKQITAIPNLLTLYQ